jgi:hypothetical protein
VAQKRRSPLEHRSNRLKLPVRKKPFFDQISGVRGVLLGYRRNQDNGTWVVRVTKDGGDWTKAIGKADDHDEVEDHPGPVLTYEQAQNEAKRVAGAGKPGGENTVKAAIDRYETDLENRGGNIKVVRRVHRHMTDKLANKPVGALAQSDLSTWRDSLLTKMKPASVNRRITVVRAALNLAADSEERITKRPWKTGLKAVAGAGQARNVTFTGKLIKVTVTMDDD